MGIPGSRLRRAALLPLLLGLTLGLAACGPEAARERGGGRGADVGNVDEEVQLQGDEPLEERIYFDTPIRPPAEAGESA